MRRLFFILALTCCLFLSLAAQADRPAISINAGANLHDTGAEIVQVGSGSNSLQLLNSTDLETTLQFNVGEFKKFKVEINSEDWYHILLSKEGKMLDAGYPELPVFNRSIIIDNNAKMNLEVYDVKYEDIKLPTAPSKGNLTRDIDPDTVPYTFGDVYSENEFYPKQVATLSEPYIMRDFRGIVVRTNPFAYNPETQTLRIYTSYKIRVYQDGIDDVNVLNTTRDEISRAFVEVYENHFVNWNASRYTSISDSFGKFLIVYHDAFEDQAEPLLQWKRQKGILGYFVPFSDIGTTAANLQSAISTYYSAGVDFVILIGDAAQIPTLSVGGGGSDPSFALVAGADSYPDLFISRLSATTAADVTTQVNKIITYERDYTTAQNWMYWASGIASDEGGGAQGDDGESDIQHMENIRTDLQGYGYSVDQLYDPGVTDTDVSNVINWGTSLINYCGHGGTYSFSTSGFNTTDVANLTNGVKYPIINAVACLVGNFVSYTCLAESFLRKSNGGGVAFWGSSINQPWNPPMAAQDEVVDLLVADSKKTIGGLFFNGACKMLDDYPSDANTLKTWNIFGDCSMLARTKNPIAMTVTHTNVLNLNVANTVTVNTGVPYAYIGISIGSVTYNYGYANASGVFTTTMTPTTFTTYTLTVTAHNRVTYVGNIYAGFVWDGSASNVWTGWANWNCNAVPTSTSDVLIPSGLSTYPSTVAAAGYCKNLTVNAGASVTVSSYLVHVYGTAKFYGQLQITGSNDFDVDDDILWYSGSTANITNTNGEIYCGGDMTFYSGSNVQFANGYLEFDGSSSSYLRNYSSNTQFNHIRSDVTNDATFVIHDDTTYDIVINGTFYNYNGRKTYCWYTGNVIIKGNLMDYNTTASYGVLWYHGTVKMDGSTQTISLAGSSAYVNNLTISPSNSVSLSNNLTIQGKLRIESGVFNASSYTITVGGDWENVVGPTAFTEGTSTVILNGTGTQTVSTETFGTLQLNKSSGTMTIPSGSTVICASYDWVAGAYSVTGGSFTANDLADDGIYGTISMTAGSINLTQDTSSLIDLRAALTISGGEFHVYGGTGQMLWGYGNPSSLTLSSSGVINVHDRDVYVWTAATFTSNITGGTIKVAKSFYCSRTDFNPTGGVLEMYSSSDVVLYMEAGSLYNVKINKTAREGEREYAQIEPADTRTGLNLEFNNTRTNSVQAWYDFPLDINGYFIINAGTFTAPANMYVASYWRNYVGPAAFVEGDGTVTLDGTFNVYVYSETFNNLVLNKPGTAYIYIAAGQTVTSNSYDWTSGKLYVDGGTFTALDMVDSYIYGTIELTSGAIHFHQETTQFLDLQANVTITGGELHLYGINGSTYWPYGGNASLTMSSGLIEIHDTGLYISSSNTFTTNITGGTIKIAKNLNCYRADFNPGGSSTIEFNTAFDSYVNMSAGTLNNLTVNKAARSAEQDDYDPILVTDRDGNETLLTRANTVYLNTDVTCQYMYIIAGSFNPNSHTLSSNSHFDNAGTVIMNNAASKIDAVYDIYWMNGSVASGTLGTYECGAQWNVYSGATVVLPATINTYLLANASRSILLSGTGTQFGTLYISGTTGTPVYTIHSNSTQNMLVAGDLIIGSGNELDLNLKNLTVNGNLDLDGKLDIHATTASITGKPSFATTSVLAIDSGTFIYYDSSIPRDIHLYGTLSISSGTFEAVNNAIVIESGSVNTMTSGQIICDGIRATAASTFQPAGGTVKLTSSPGGGIHWIYLASTNWLPNLIINTSTGIYLNADALVNGNITIDDGRLDTNHYNLNCTGNIIVNAGGILEVDVGGWLIMRDGKSLNVNVGGRLDALGDEFDSATLSNLTGYTNYNIESGGTIAASYAAFVYMGAEGVNVKPGAIVDASHPFNNCYFSSGVAGGTLLTLNNNQNLVITNAYFDTNTWGGASNVRKTQDASLVNFFNANGGFAGESYDDDIHERIFWTTNSTPATPDLQILKAEYSDTNPDIGETVTCTVTYVNASTTATGSCYLDLYWNETSPPGYWAGNQSTIFPAISAGYPHVYVFNVTPDASWAGTWNSYVQIDADGLVTESNETNNVYGPFNITWNLVVLPAIDDLSIEIAAGTYYKRLTWTYPQTVSHFNIYRSADPLFTPGPATFIANVTYPTMQYVDTTTADKYFYIVTAEQVAAALTNPETPRNPLNQQRRNK